jgi:PleD family two-component response regulator
MSWDADNFSFDEYSDVCKKLDLYTSVNPMHRKNVQSSVTSAADPITGQLPKLKRKFILITDDSYYNRKAVGEMINRKNIQTIDDINGQDAVLKVQNSFDRESTFS